MEGLSSRMASMTDANKTGLTAIYLHTKAESIRPKKIP